MKTMRTLLFLIAACGTEPPAVDVTLEAPAKTDARVSISAALDVSELIDDGIADRLVIENITVNLAEVRLLAAHPGIPPGGLSLLENDALLEFYGHEDSRLDLPFPDDYLTRDDLAVYLRIDVSDELEGSSIIIDGKLYAQPLQGSKKPLTADDAEDEEEADSMGPNLGSLDPDPDPVRPLCSLDPDPDPVMCGKKALTAREESVSFELRASDVADLVAGLDPNGDLSVVVGIPASRWFTDEVIADLAAALEANETPGDAPDDGADPRDTIIVEAEHDERMGQDGDKIEDSGDDYFVDNKDVDDLTLR
jgi:hypothetical protein